MNDIEILEKFKDDCLNIHEADIEGIQIGHAIENLIQRNKDLEQIEKEHKKENGRLREENELLRYGLRENKILRHGLKENTEEIDKFYKIINLMAEEMVNGVYKFRSKKQVINYFTNKVEEDK